MYEESIELLMEHKQYLTEALLPDFSESEDFDDIEFRSKLGDIEDDLKNIEYFMPYDEIDEDNVTIGEMSGENLEGGEFEDEIVEIRFLIEELYKMVEEVKLQYFDDNGEILVEYAHTRPAFKYGEECFLEDLFSWLNEEIIRKSSKKGPVNHLFSRGLYHITFEMIKAFDSQGCTLDFRDTLNFHREVWEDLI